MGPQVTRSSRSHRAAGVVATSCVLLLVIVVFLQTYRERQKHRTLGQQDLKGRHSTTSTQEGTDTYSGHQSRDGGDTGATPENSGETPNKNDDLYGRNEALRLLESGRKSVQDLFVQDRNQAIAARDALEKTLAVLSHRIAAGQKARQDVASLIDVRTKLAAEMCEQLNNQAMFSMFPYAIAGILETLAATEEPSVIPTLIKHVGFRSPTDDVEPRRGYTSPAFRALLIFGEVSVPVILERVASGQENVQTKVLAEAVHRIGSDRGQDPHAWLTSAIEKELDPTRRERLRQFEQQIAKKSPSSGTSTGSDR